MKKFEIYANHGTKLQPAPHWNIWSPSYYQAKQRFTKEMPTIKHFIIKEVPA